MTATTVSRYAGAPGAIVLLWLLVPASVLGQEREAAVRPIAERQLEAPPSSGLVMDEGGGWRAPTPAEALLALRGGSNNLGVQPRYDPVSSVLRQVHGARSAAELAAVTDALVDILLADTEFLSDEDHARRAAYVALAGAARERGEGTPYPAAFDALVRVYETRAARALADGGDDPFLEVHRRGTRIAAEGLGMALLDIFRADPEGRGRDYLLDLFAASEPPPPCHLEGLVEDPETAMLPPCPNRSVWCEAITPLMDTRGPGDPRSKKPRGIPGAPEGELFDRLCAWGLSIVS